MNVGQRVGLGATALLTAGGATGFGMYQLTSAADRRIERQIGALDRDLAARSDEWSTWNGKLEAEFPGRRLDTPADHARFDQFLAENPAPTWVDVEHADFTKARISTDGVPRSEDAWQPDSTGGQGIAYTIGFGGLIGIGGAVGGISGLAKAASPRMAILSAAGAGAAAAFGTGAVVGGIANARAESNAADKGMRELRATVNAQ